MYVEWGGQQSSIATESSYVCTVSNEESLAFDTYISDSVVFDIKGEKLSSSSQPYYYHFDIDNFEFGYCCYDFLDSAQKILYDAIIQNVGKRSFTVTFPNNVFAESNLNDNYLTVIMDAVCADRPDIFYYAGYGITGGYYYPGSKYIKTLNYQVGVFDNVSQYDTDYYTDSNLPEYYSALMAKIPQVPVDLSNRYNFIKSVHDYLADTVYYPDLNSSDYKMSAHDAYGALIEGRAVCQGYSDAIKLLCDYYNIPCVCISGKTDTGGGHMWNAVQMDDGKWYFIDCTWDDQGNKGTFYDFFLTGSETTSSYGFGGKKFSAEHINDDNLAMPLPRLAYSSTAYERNQNHNTLFGATYNSAADFDDNYLYLSAFDAGKSNIYFNGINIPVNDFANNVKFNAKSGLNSGLEEWIIILLGDLNSDDICDEMDYSVSINLWKTTDNVIDTTEERSCDVNLDGVIDALDLAIIARASTGANTNIVLE